MRTSFLAVLFLAACTSKDGETDPVLCDDADSDGVCDEVDECPEGDDAIDDDMDGIIDACDECPNGDNVTDSDDDGLPDGCDPCPGVAVPSAFHWVVWDAPILSSTATGSVGDTAVTYSSSLALATSTEVFDHYKFPTEWNVPNDNPTIRNDEVTSNTIDFGRSVVDPVFAFASIGRPSLAVTVSFDQDIDVRWERDLSEVTDTTLTGLEGYAIVTIPGVHTSIDFEYLDAEAWANFAFGFAGTAEDIDGDGQADFCDPCPTDPDDECEG